MLSPKRSAWNSLPSAITGGGKPMPSSHSHTFFKPSFGHRLMIPFSGETPSRVGPRNVGQSAAPVALARGGAAGSGGSAGFGAAAGSEEAIFGAGSAHAGMRANVRSSASGGR